MNDWQAFFDGHADKYDAEVFTANTEQEIEFLRTELNLPSGARILDLGCGTGRHSVGLASLGFQVTGVDLSDGMLRRARARAQEAGVKVEFMRADAVEFERPETFDAAICLCEGAMCLLAEGDDPISRDLRILSNLHRSLKPGGRLILNVLNACRIIRKYSDADVAAGRFDPVRLMEIGQMEIEVDGASRTIPTRERVYTAPEINRMLITVGFEVERIWGGTAGAWDRGVPMLDEFELMLIAKKQGLWIEDSTSTQSVP